MTITSETALADDAARRLLRVHCTASDYAPCVAASAGLQVPPALAGPAALWATAAAAVAAGFGLLHGAQAAAAAARVAEGLAGAADAALDSADAATVLAWCTALAEWCERHGLDAEHARLRARAERADVQPGCPAAARVHWRIAAAWHDEAFGRFDGVLAWLDAAEQIAHDAADATLVVVVGLKRARLALSRADPAAALARADAIEARLPAGEAPLWRADIADIRARAALSLGDLPRALQQARLCDGHARLAQATPAYTITYRLHEAYALLGLGQVDAAVALVRELAALPMPARMQQRTALLAALFGLLRDEAMGRWGDEQRTRLRATVAQLRALDWIGVLALLPAQVARLWARALEADIEPAWVRASIVARGLQPPVPGGPEAWPWPLRLRVLGAFSCESAQAQAQAGNAAGRPALKPLELLQHLSARAGTEPLPVEAVAAALWPGDGREGRDKALETTLARLRRWLGDAEAVLLHERRLRLNPQRVWVDRDALERAFERLQQPGVEPAEQAAAWQCVMALLRGPLLADAGTDAEAPPWLHEARTRLRQRLAAALIAARAGTDGAAIQARELRARAADPGLAAWL